MDDFKISKVHLYKGPNAYLKYQAIVFNLTITPGKRDPGLYLHELAHYFPRLQEKTFTDAAHLYAATLQEILRMDINLFIHENAVTRDGEEFVIAINYLDEKITMEAMDLAAAWFSAIAGGESFDFETPWIDLQERFGRTFFGGPTFYSLYEAAQKRSIPVFYLYEENQFQWGYGCKQVRGRSTTFSVDSIKDTEFTMFKDMVGDFLEMCGFPTPRGFTCFSEERAVSKALELGFPVVVKPVSGHKGQGVSTNINSVEEVRKACRVIMASSDEDSFDGIIVQKQIYGTDHRLLSVKGKFAAGLQRVPAYVDGNGKDTIRTLIERENSKEIRLDNARSPLGKIHMDDDLVDFIKRKGLTLDSVPPQGERVYLRRVANISAGGVSINVTEKVHPKNVKLVEDIASFFNVTCLGIDVLAEEISKPWTDGDFGIIEINAGPGVFMHLAPAIGGSVDVPGMIMHAHFPEDEYARIPIIAGHTLTPSFASALYRKLDAAKPGIFFGALTREGIAFNDQFFTKNRHHDQNVKIILRHPKLEFALFNHTKDDIWDYGMFHEGADIVILEEPGAAEAALKRDLLPDGYLVEVKEDDVILSREGKEISRTPVEGDKERAIIKAITPILPGLTVKYEA